MIGLVYVSQAKYLFQEAELKSLLDMSRKNNTAHGITGLLLYDGGGTFIQVLEGEQEQIDKLYEIINQDPRHHSLGQLSYTEITERTFPDWKMGYKLINPHGNKLFEGYSTFMNESHTEESSANFTFEMLKYFKEISS